ncbi:MAG TPA: hypothetical protein VM101_04415 [Flavitalea sp.]|nr:hypothetical protein [Flavitalea sp.]
MNLIFRAIKMLLPVLFLLSTKKQAHAQTDVTGTPDNKIQYIPYPDFPDANSTWGSIGYNPADKSVYVGVTNHKDKVGLYVYNTGNNTMKLNGFVQNLGYLRDYQWQGKVHSKIVGGPDGAVYFSTDGGESKEEYLMDHPKGYAGGYLMKWDPKLQKLTNFGTTLQYESIKDVEVDQQTGKIYAVTYPQVHFIVFDPKTNAMIDLGRLGSSHVPRVIFTDKWGNCYYVDWRQRLVKYEKSTGKLVFAENSLPSFPGTPGEHIITGVTGYAKDTVKNIIYLVTYGAKMLAFHPQENGIGGVDDLGGAFDGNKEPWHYYVPNLNIGNNGKLYYIIGGHGNFAIKDKTVLMEFDPGTKKKQVLYQFTTDQIVEATGSDIKDEHGNIYFAGRKMMPYDANSKDSERKLDQGISVPFTIKFNPDKIQ